MKSTIVEHTLSNGKNKRMCLRCMLYVDANGNIDLDHYTARQYLKFMAVPADERCKHEIDVPDSKPDIMKMIDCLQTKRASVEDYAAILRAIVRRLP